MNQNENARPFIRFTRGTLKRINYFWLHDLGFSFMITPFFEIYIRGDLSWNPLVV